MKYSILLALALVFSTPVIAATQTTSVRTSTAVVAVGDSQSSMIDKLGRPNSSHEYTTRNNRGYLLFATDYTYSINNLKYTISVANGHIFRISWER